MQVLRLHTLRISIEYRIETGTGNRESLVQIRDRYRDK